jgi:hypothetical protein
MRPFHWFKATTWQQLRDRLIAASADAWLEVHLDGDKMTLQVVEPSADAVAQLAPLNESYLCPPICPH